MLCAATMTAQCTGNRENRNLLNYDDKGRQLLTMNELTRDGERWQAPVIVKNAPDSVAIGDEFRATIYLDNPDIRILEAYFDCTYVDNASVDTATFELSGCSKKLLVRNDSVQIGLHSSEIGEHEFPEITLLTMDRQRVLRTLNYTFSYKIIKP